MQMIGDFCFENHDKESFRRLTKNQPVGLKYVGIVLSLMREVTDALGNTIEVVVSASPLTEHNKPKAFIHWVSHPITAEVRLYDLSPQYKATVYTWLLKKLSNLRNAEEKRRPKMEEQMFY
ncbi:hypothetical protein DICVIV_01048 [Dictyocaulus viviparus]|uniref:Uncharacterized protein n=1 Tax=Dictyocaulus viviparus TaxID=29172 RepID=A0A0D8Y9R8_DICVI|nr:hypothetical protein DICVIV_01048 [Dictyocaulus viviparus]